MRLIKVEACEECNEPRGYFEGGKHQHLDPERYPHHTERDAMLVEDIIAWLESMDAEIVFGGFPYDASEVLKDHVAEAKLDAFKRGLTE